MDAGVSFGGLKGRSQPKQDPPIEKDLSLTLEEIFNGSIKKMKIARKVNSFSLSGNCPSTDRLPPAGTERGRPYHEHTREDPDHHRQARVEGGHSSDFPQGGRPGT